MKATSLLHSLTHPIISRTQIYTVDVRDNSRMSVDCHCLVTYRGIYQTVPIYGASASVNRDFEEGKHYIEYKAVDESGNFDSCSFTVSIIGKYFTDRCETGHDKNGIQDM